MWAMYLDCPSSIKTKPDLRIYQRVKQYDYRQVKEFSLGLVTLYWKVAEYFSEINTLRAKLKWTKIEDKQMRPTNADCEEQQISRKRRIVKTHPFENKRCIVQHEIQRSSVYCAGKTYVVSRKIVSIRWFERSFWTKSASTHGASNILAWALKSPVCRLMLPLGSRASIITDPGQLA